MFSFLSYISLFGAFFSCTPEKPHVIEGNRIINNFNKIAVKDGLSPFGIGGAMFDDIEKFELTYQYYAKSISLDEARNMIITKAEALFALTNTESAKPYLRYYPYDQEHVLLGVTFVDEKGNKLGSGQLTCVMLAKGTIFFESFVNGQFKDLFTEPYAEAYQKVYGVPLPDRRKQFGLDN